MIEPVLADLPPVLATIAQVAGIKIALEIARLHGGTKVIVPTRPGRNWLTKIVGREHAMAVIEALGPARLLDVPLGPAGGFYLASRQQRARLFAELEASEASEAQVARAMGVTGRAVRYRRAKARHRLPDLFD